MGDRLRFILPILIAFVAINAAGADKLDLSNFEGDWVTECVVKEGHWFKTKLWIRSADFAKWVNQSVGFKKDDAQLFNGIPLKKDSLTVTSVTGIYSDDKCQDNIKAKMKLLVWNIVHKSSKVPGAYVTHVLNDSGLAGFELIGNITNNSFELSADPISKDIIPNKLGENYKRLR